METIQNDSTGEAAPKIIPYKVKGGTIDSGKKYEFKIATLLSLKQVLKDEDNMWLGFNMKDAGVFDDIVLRSGSTTYFLQLKHKDNPKPLTIQELQAAKGDFALVKYFESVVEFNNNNNSLTSSNMYFILFNNRGVNDFLKATNNVELNALNTSSGGKIHEINMDQLPSAKFKCQHPIYLFSHQTDVKTIDLEIQQEIEKVAQHLKLAQMDIAGVADNFTKYITNWAEGNFGLHYRLTKTEVLQKLSELFLAKYEISLNERKLGFCSYHNINTWNRIIRKKTVTFIEFEENALNFVLGQIRNEVKQYCKSIPPDSSWSCKSQVKDEFYQNDSLKWQMKRRVVKDFINCIDIYKCLWKAAQLPLLLEITATEHYDNILEILRFSRNCYRVIIVYKNEEPLPVSRHNHDACFFTLNDLTTAEKSSIVKSTVSLQGRPSILEDLVDPSMFHLITCNDIIKILCGNFNIGDELTPAVEYFVQRRISRVLVKTKVLDEIQDEKFVIEGKSDKYFESGERSNVYKWENFDFSEVANRKISSGEARADQHQEEKSTDQPIHHFVVYDANYFEWKASYGSLDNIKKYVSDLDDADESDVLMRLSSRMTVLSGIPGMGKSMLMDYIARKVPTNKWVVKIDLNSHTDYFQSLKKNNSTLNTSDHLRYLNNLATKSDLKRNLADAIFTKLRASNDVVVLLDGFDEVSILYKKIVSHIARYLYNEGCHILISTRPHMESFLEQELQSFPITLKPFSEHDQTEFLKKYFSPKTADKNAQFFVTEFVEKLLRATSTNLGDVDKEFTGIPLLTKLLADVFLDDCHTFVANAGHSNFTENFDILYLYRTFIAKKIDIASEKSRDSSPRETFKLYKQCHSIHALELLFPEHHSIISQIKKRPIFNYTSECQELVHLQKAGILIVDKSFNVNFIHRSFSEYLAANWLAKNVRSSDEEHRKAAQILLRARFDNDNQFLFVMFDRIVSKDCPLHINIINGKVNQVLEMIKFDSTRSLINDNCERSLLHLAALYGKQYPQLYQNRSKIFKARLLLHLKAFDDNGVLDVINSIVPFDITNLVKPDLLGYTPFDYAVARCSITVAHHIHNICEKPFISARINLERKNDYLGYCALQDYKTLFTTLITYFASKDLLLNNVHRDEVVSTYYKKIFQKHEDSEIIVSYIAQFQQETILQLLERKAEEVLPWFANRHSSLHYSAAFGTRKKVLSLIQLNKEVNEADADYNTPLHYAALHHNAGVIDVLLQSGAKTKEINADYNTPLHLAVSHSQVHQSTIVRKAIRLIFKAKNYIAIANKLILKGADINAQNINGNTPAHLALLNEKRELAAWFIAQGARYDISNNVGNTLLHLCADFGYNDIITEILKINVDAKEQTDLTHGSKSNIPPNLPNINKQNKSSQSALHRAIPRNNCATSIDINSQNNFGNTALHLATEQNNLDVVKLLISNGACVDVVNEKGRNPFMRAAYHGHNDIVRELLLSSAINVNIRDTDGGTALYWAARQNHLDVVKLLISNGACVDVVNEKGINPLMIAAFRGHNDIVRELLLSNAIDVNIRNTYEDTALHSAAEENHLDVVKLLISNGACVDVVNDKGMNPLMIAAFRGHNDIVRELLLSNAIDVNIRDTDGDTALHSAAGQNHLDVVKLLISNGACVDVVNEKGMNPLMIAAFRGHNDIVRELLLSNAIDVNIRNTVRYTALRYAALQNHLDVVKLLISNGACVDVVNEQGVNPLMIAAYHGHKDIVRELLLSNAIDVNIRNTYGDTALHSAAGQNHLDVVKLLISNGACVDVVNERGMNPLMIAAYHGHNDIVRELLLSNAIDVNIRNTYEHTALHSAAGQNHLDVVKLLISNGACVDVVNEKGMNPLMIAAFRGHNDIVRELLLSNAIDVNIRNTYEDTALHSAAGQNHLDVVKLLISNGACVDVVNEKGMNPLMIAAFRGHNDIVRELLLSNAIDVNIRNTYEDTALHSAAGQNHLDVVKLLISNGACVDVVNEKGMNPLMIAAFRGHNDIVRELLLSNAIDVNIRNTYEHTALHSAAGQNHLDVVKLLISNGACVDVVNEKGMNPLMIAAFRGHNDIVRELLLSNAIDVNIRNTYEDTALHSAAGQNHLDVVKLLISNGACVDVVNEKGMNPLMIAAFRGHNDIVRELLLSNAIDVNIRDTDGDTALHSAAGQNHLDVVKLLISNGACVDVVNEIGMNPLMSTASRGHNDIVRELLLSSAINVNIRDTDGDTALHSAAKQNNLDVVKLLISNGACVDVVNEIGMNPLMSAAFRGHNDIVRELLLSSAINVNRKDTDGDTALNLAALENHLDVVKLLISNGACEDVVNEQGMNPLMIAAYHGHNDIVRELLLSNAIDVNIRDTDEDTALHCAGRQNHFDVVKLLISNGASVDVVNEKGRNPLMIAAYHGHIEIVRELTLAGADITSKNVSEETALH